MRTAILSDIHANRAALQAVLCDAKGAGAQEYWFLGDVLGYGPDPVCCLNMLDGLGSRLTAWLMGNHDAWWFGLPGARPEDGASSPDVLWALRKQAEELGLPPPRPASNPGWNTFDWQRWQLRSLPSNVAVKAFLVHGRPVLGDTVCPWIDYTRTPEEALYLLDAVERGIGCRPQLVVTGHTHVARLMCCTRHGTLTRGSVRPLPVPWGRPIPLDWGEKIYFVNPGSAGMPPRNRSAGDRVTYALLDIAGATLEFRRVGYPVQETIDAMQAKRFLASLKERFRAS